ncbi:MAG TPA: HXXEE domain-containing protein [Terriglobales bacterium]|nr:HXXEE domain-containing protein [Terriglobales bacterium]
MSFGDAKQRFGICWLFFGYTLALHVLDEAGHDFLSVYLPNAIAIRRAAPFLPIPIFNFQSWIGSLALALTFWLVLTPLAFRGYKALRALGVFVAIVPGLMNGAAHILSSVYMKRWMPGVYSAPLLLLSGTALLRSALMKDKADGTRATEAGR